MSSDLLSNRRHYPKEDYQYLMKSGTVTHSTLSRKGATLHYWLAGTADQHPLLVFTHGAAMDHRMFRDQMAVLSQRYRILAWDVRGHGMSQPLNGHFSLDEAADDLLAILDDVGAKQSVLVGHSMGGLIAQKVVLNHPERVAALAVIGSVCITMPPSPYDLWLMMLTTSTIHFCPLPLQRMLIASTTALTPSAQSYAYTMLRRVSHQQMVSLWHGLMGCFHDLPDYQIAQPILLTHGQFDTWGNVHRLTPQWARRDPKSTYVIIPAAGHNANQDNPHFFNTTLTRFLHHHGVVCA